MSKTDPLLAGPCEGCLSFPPSSGCIHGVCDPAPGLAPNPSPYIQSSPSTIVPHPGSLRLLLHSSDLPRCHVSPSQHKPVLAAAVPLPGASQSPSSSCQTHPAPRRSRGSSRWCWCSRGAGAGGSPHPGHGASPCLEQMSDRGTSDCWLMVSHGSCVGLGV